MECLDQPVSVPVVVVRPGGGAVVVVVVVGRAVVLGRAVGGGRRGRGALRIYMINIFLHVKKGQKNLTWYGLL